MNRALKLSLTKTSIQKRIEIIDVLRGIAILLMILGHSFIVYPINITDIASCKLVQNWIYTFHMELFFFLAGIVYRCSNYRKFIKKKFIRLGIPYLIFGLLTLCMHILGGSLVNKKMTLEEGFFGLIFYGGSYWFLYTLCLVSLLYPLIDRLCNTNTKKICLIILLICINSIFSFPSLFALKKIFYYLPYFIIGHFLSKLKNWYSIFLSSHEGGVKNVNFLLISSFLLGYFIFDVLADKTNSFLLTIIISLRAICMIFFITLFFLSLLNLFNKYKIKTIIVNFLVLCSTFSLQLYLFNGYLLVFFRVLICSVLGISNALLIVLGIWIGNIIVGLSLCLLLEKIPVIRMLCGLSVIGREKYGFNN